MTSVRETEIPTDSMLSATASTADFYDAYSAPSAALLRATAAALAPDFNLNSLIPKASRSDSLGGIPLARNF